LLWLGGFGAATGRAQTVNLQLFSAANLVAYTGLSEELGEVLLLAEAACGTAFDTVCISSPGSIQVTYTDVVFENTTASGITVCETLSGVTVCNAPGAFLTGDISLGSTSQGGVVSFGIQGGADFAAGDQVRISGVRARVDQTSLATPGTVSNALLTVAPVAAANFSPTIGVIARSADPLSLSTLTETKIPCVPGEPVPVLQINEEYGTAFVDHGDALESVFPGPPANPRPPFGANSNTRIRLVAAGLVPDIAIQWPASVPAVTGGAVLDLVSQTPDGSEAVYIFGTPDQGQSDSQPEVFEIQLAVANFTFSGNDPLQGHVTVQGQLLPPATPSSARPRYDHPLEPVPGVPLLELRRCHTTTGSVQVFAQVDGLLWFGNLDFELQGPTPLSRSRVPIRLENLQPGDYTMQYIAGGPAGATFIGFPQPQTQSVGAGQTQVFAFSFAGPTIARLELSSAPANVCPTSDTVISSVQLVNTSEELQIIPAGTRFIFTFSRPIVGPFVLSGPPAYGPAEVSGATVSYELIDRVPLSPGQGLSFSGARLNLAGLGDGQSVTVQFTTEPLSAIELPANQSTVAVTDTLGCAALVPSFSAAGVTNGASFAPGIAPGSIATLFGTNLTGSLSGTLLAGSLPLPLELGGTSLTVNGIPAPLFAIANVNGQEQINFQVPWELAGLLQATIVVTHNGVSSAPVVVDLLPAAPGIFTLDGVRAVMLHGSGPERDTLVTDSSPARPNEIVTIFATGLGPVTNPPASGQAATAEPLSHTLQTPVVFLGGSQADSSAQAWFSGLAPGFVGLYQINFHVPSDVLPGPRGLAVQVGDRMSEIVTVPIQ
jgi:uncharacterized protein (TIGR03437 family)